MQSIFCDKDVRQLTNMCSETLSCKRRENKNEVNVPDLLETSDPHGSSDNNEPPDTKRDMSAASVVNIPNQICSKKLSFTKFFPK